MPGASCRRLGVGGAGERAVFGGEDRHDGSGQCGGGGGVGAALVELLPEKNSESRMIEPKSAIEAAAMTSSPRLELMLPESFSTGKITPSAVATRTTAMNSGDFTKPPDRRPIPIRIAMANDTTNPSAVSFTMRPRRRSTSISRPERNSRNASPIRARTETGASGFAQPSPEGPITMPSTISSTIAGSRTRGRSRAPAGEQADSDDDEQVGEHGSPASVVAGSMKVMVAVVLGTGSLGCHPAEAARPAGQFRPRTARGWGWAGRGRGSGAAGRRGA
jgi:hypothetical protein